MTTANIRLTQNSALKLLKAVLVGALYILLILTTVVTVLSFCGKYSHVCELLSHLRLIWCLLSVIVTALLFACNCRITALLSSAILMLNAEPIIELYAPAKLPDPKTAASHITILQMNVWGGRNHDYDRALNLARQINPDMIAVEENTQAWSEQLERALTDYPYKKVEWRYGGIALFSRIAWQDARVEYFGERRRPRIRVEMTLDGRPVTLIFAHPAIPLGDHHHRRNKEIAVLEEEVKAIAQSKPVVLFGDLNCTPWSWYFEKLKEETKLVDTEQGLGMQPSWSTRWVMPLLPIDHCLVSRDFAVIKRTVEPAIGSDHLPVYVELGLPPEKSDSAQGKVP